jgi:predicted dehydrogenase
MTKRHWFGGLARGRRARRPRGMSPGSGHGRSPARLDEGRECFAAWHDWRIIHAAWAVAGRASTECVSAGVHESLSVLRIGVIGCGRAAVDLHLPALARIPESTVIAVSDPDVSRMPAAARQFPKWQDLVAHADVDAFLVSVPTAFHHDVFIGAAAAGKPVYLEKPLALDLAEASSMVDAARGLKVTMGFNLRSHRLVSKAREMVRSGALGPITAIRSALHSGLKTRPEWQKHLSQGGGPLYELGAHHFDLWSYLLDARIDRVTCQGEAETAVAVSAVMSTGALASATLAFCGTDTNEIELIGESSSVRFSLYRADSFRIRPQGRITQLRDWIAGLPEAASAARRGGDLRDSYRVHWLRFLESVRAGQSGPATIEDGLHSLKAIIACLG